MAGSRTAQFTSPRTLRAELEGTMERGDKLRIPASKLMNVLNGTSTTEARSLMMYLKSKQKHIQMVGGSLSDVEAEVVDL